MADALKWEMGSMKKEGLILNALCIAFALAFLALVAWNFLNSPNIGSFLSIDNLFLTAVFTLLALVLLINPLMTLKDNGMLRNPLKRNASKSAMIEASDVNDAPTISSGRVPASLPPAVIASSSTTAARVMPQARPVVMKDVKGRAMPPDVQKMVTQMKEKE